MEPWATFRIHNRLKMPGSSEKDRLLIGPCISRPSPRVATTPIRSESCRRHLFLKFLKAGAEVTWAIYAVMLDEFEESR
jgi:hypothetical protein